MKETLKMLFKVIGIHPRLIRATTFQWQLANKEGQELWT
jgi:hypothetical protein